VNFNALFSHVGILMTVKLALSEGMSCFFVPVSSARL
jgi:hypothetical protein